MSKQFDTRLLNFDRDRLEHWNQELRYKYETLRTSLRIVFNNDMAKVGGGIMLMYLFAAVFAPLITPHQPDQRVETASGDWVTSAPPSLNTPFGTTSSGYDIFTQVIYGSRVAFLAGLLTAFMVGIIGSTLGIVAGYYGGNVQNAIMRLVDFAYGLPFLPFAIVLIMLFGTGSIYAIVVVISMILWRGTARVIRSEVISIREQPMIDAARASGASDRRIIFYHIFPKVLPITVLYSVFAIGWAIIAEAGLSFLGFADLGFVSWGHILNEAYFRGAVTQEMWFWVIPPGLAIVFFVMAAYFIAQGIEELTNPQLRKQYEQ